MPKAAPQPLALPFGSAFYAVYNYGGIYLDMDMEAVKPFDPLLNDEIMLGYVGGTVDSGIQAACFGAVKWHPHIKKCTKNSALSP
jgi:mannosyltransferase OCH1-like enzyme